MIQNFIVTHSVFFYCTYINIVLFEKDECSGRVSADNDYDNNFNI